MNSKPLPGLKHHFPIYLATDVRVYMRDVLRSLSEHVGLEIAKFEAQVEHVPETCRIEDCPLG